MSSLYIPVARPVDHAWLPEFTPRVWEPFSIEPECGSQVMRSDA